MASWSSDMEAISAIFMIILVLCFWLACAFGIPMGITWLVQYAVAGIWHQDLPFWPVLAGVLVVWFFLGGFRVRFTTK